MKVLTKGSIRVVFSSRTLGTVIGTGVVNQSTMLKEITNVK